jgi:hypothetical protein
MCQRTPRLLGRSKYIWVFTFPEQQVKMNG